MADNGEVQIIITDSKTNNKYIRGRFLGKGGFARCYEFTNLKTNEVVAGKVVSKSGLVKPQHKSKMSQEISIHRSTTHQYVVKFYSYFEDKDNIYIMLELCRKRSLMEMHKRRRALTVPEVRYFMNQITQACQYLHDNRIIHRDLKLGNLFINDDMNIKVGDFGLATKLSYTGERKKTLCGTPNYIAPEILNKEGHSYEVDLWSLGCIMYTLLVGVPPFETSSLKATYSKIKSNDYFMPPDLDVDARDLISSLLHPKADMRPCPSKILAHKFFQGHIPNKLPTSCLTMAPRANQSIMECSKSTRMPLVDKNKDHGLEKKGASTDLKLVKPEQKNEAAVQNSPANDFHIMELKAQLTSVMKCNPEAIYTGQDEDSQDPSLVPFVWISKWIDYSDKYGLGYCLFDNSKGVYFADETHFLRMSDEQTLQYIDKNGADTFYNMNSVPPLLAKKKKLLEFFITYMNENLCIAGESARPREGDEMVQVPHVRKWVRTSTAMLFHLTNGTLQLNFFKDHTKIIICPVMGAASYIDENKNFTVYNLKSIEKHGCSNALAIRLGYALNMAKKHL